jgi:hypothetical protein
LGPIPNPQSPIPNPQSPIPIEYNKYNYNRDMGIKVKIKKINLFYIIMDE